MKAVAMAWALAAAGAGWAQQVPAFLTDSAGTAWADSVLGTLSLDRMTAQLLMPPVYSREQNADWAREETWCREFGIGGVIAMQGQPELQRERMHRLQDASAIPLMVSTDAEWGASMRFTETHGYPRAITLGATDDPALVRRMGQLIAEDLRMLGIHVNFAPDVDINSNPANPVIGFRSFGEDPERVTRLGIAYSDGLQSRRVLATAKHFPGHGDTDADSHLTLPTLKHDRARFDSVELVPFRGLSDAGVGAMMAAHLNIPELEPTPGLPSTLSRGIVTDLLRGEIGFQGLVFTDAMSMKGFADFAETETPNVDALLAGNDVLLFPADPEVVIAEVRAAVAEGRLDSAVVAEKCRRVLQAKHWSRAMEALPVWGEVLEGGAVRDSVHRAILEAAVTVVTNRRGVLPLGAGVRDVKVLRLGSSEGPLAERLGRVMGGAVRVEDAAFPSDVAKWWERGDRGDAIVVAVSGTDRRVGKGYGVSGEELAGLEDLAARVSATPGSPPLVVVVFGSPYLLDRMTRVAALSDAVVVAYEDEPVAEAVAGELIGGAIGASGTLPVSAGGFPVGWGVPALGGVRLGFADAPFAGKAAIDSIVEAAMVQGALPGCRVVAVHRGRIVHDGCYGTLDGRQAVEPGSVYDLASITKVAASTISLMALEEAGKLSRKDRLDAHLPELAGTELGGRIVEDILAHRAGLKAWIPFYLEALEQPGVFVRQPDATHRTQVADGVYQLDSYRDTILQRIVEAEVDPVGTNRYSDLGYYLLQQVVERLSDQTLDQFVTRRFYEPMGLTRIGFQPMNWAVPSEIAPTEMDQVFREQTVHGHVHDPGAAMLGGVAGHAGLFSNAYDLARLFYMLMRGGYYGGEALLDAETIHAWTQRVDPDPEHRKACGFDRPEAEPDEGPTCNEAGWASFGHTGFTGTVAWADPDADLVFIFLSNRVHPNAENWKLVKLNVRTEIQRVIYQTLQRPERFSLHD